MAIVDLSADLIGSSSLAAVAVASLSAVADMTGSSSVTAQPKVTYKPSAALAGGSTLQATVTVAVGSASPVHYQATTRAVTAGALVFEPVDLFLGDGKTRAQGVTASALSVKVFLNSTDTGWPIVPGSTITDGRVAAGKVYWHEFSAGFYSLRFFPNQVGLWRVVLTWTAGDQAISMTYDATAKPVAPLALGLRSTFIK